MLPVTVKVSSMVEVRVVVVEVGVVEVVEVDLTETQIKEYVEAVKVLGILFGIVLQDFAKRVVNVAMIRIPKHVRTIKPD